MDKPPFPVPVWLERERRQWQDIIDDWAAAYAKLAAATAGERKKMNPEMVPKPKHAVAMSDVPVSRLYVQCSYPMRKNAIAMSDCCRKPASSAVAHGDALLYRCDWHAGLVEGGQTGPLRLSVPRVRSCTQADREAARSEAIKALKRAFPELCDNWFGNVVDIIVATYEEWTGE